MSVSFLMMLLMSCAGCREDKTPDDSEPVVVDDSGSAGDSGDSEEPTELGFDLLISQANDRVVRRLRFHPGWQERPGSEVEELWVWDSEALEGTQRPHGMFVDGDRVIVATLDYFTDAGVLSVDLETGETQELLRAPTGVPWGGEPAAEGARFIHNTVFDGSVYISSDTHNQRVLAVDADWNPQWEISRETLSDPQARALFSQPNDVELIDINGEPHLLVSCRGDRYNQVLLFEPTEPLRPHDPPWSLIFNYPDPIDINVLLENHNPRPLDDGSGFTVANSALNRVMAVSWEGEVIWSLPEPDCPDAEAPAALDWPRDVLVLPTGELLVSDTHGERLVALSSEDGCLDAEDVVWEMTGLGEPYQIERLPYGGDAR